MEKRIKTGGRDLGTPNKITASLKERIDLIIENNLISFQQDLEALEPHQRLTLLIKLFDFVLPRQKEMKIETEIREMPIFAEIRTYEGLPDVYIDENDRKINPKDYKQYGINSTN